MRSRGQLWGAGTHSLPRETQIEAEAAAFGLSREEYVALRASERAARRVADEEKDRATMEAARTYIFETKAREAGLTVAEYKAKCEREQWLADPGGTAQAYFFVLLLICLPLTGAIGVALVAIFWAMGRPPGAAITCTLVGGLGGALLGAVLYEIVGVVFNRLAPRSPVVRRHAEGVYWLVIAIAWLLPPIAAVICSVAFSGGVAQ